MELAGLVLLMMLNGQIALCTCKPRSRTPRETATNCEDRTVVEGEKATITCRFGRDVSISKTDIDVQFYPKFSHRPVSVLRCNWLVIKPDEPTCSAASGCNFTKFSNDTVEVEIKRATKEFEGTFMCRLVPSRGVPARSCRLTIKVGPATQEDQERRKVEAATSNPDKPQTENIGPLPTSFAIILGLVIVCLIASITCIIVLAWNACRWRKERDVLRRETAKVPSDPDSSLLLAEKLPVSDV